MFKKLLAALLASTMLMGTIPVSASETTEIITEEESLENELNSEGDGEHGNLSKPEIQTYAFGDDVWNETEEINNALNTAPIMYNNYTVVGELSGSDMDIFAFHLNERNYVEFYLLTDTPGCVGGLYRENGTLIQKFDDGNNRTDKNGYYVNTLVYELPANSSNSSFYYVGVQESSKAYTTYALYFSHSPFLDVVYDDYFFDPVVWASNKAITTGTKVGYFEPNSTCTRGQIVTFLWRAAGSPAPKTSKNPFKDIKSSDYYYKAVLWAVEKGITNGISSNQFGPDQGCTRGQVVTFLHRAALTPSPSSGGKSFKDVSSSEFYYNPVRWAVQKGITQGTSDTKFSPNDTCTRGQIVTFLYRGNNVIDWKALNNYTAPSTGTTTGSTTTRLTAVINGTHVTYTLVAKGDTIQKITIDQTLYLSGYSTEQIRAIWENCQANNTKYTSAGFIYRTTKTASYISDSLTIDATSKTQLNKAVEFGIIKLENGNSNLSLKKSVDNLVKSGFKVAS